MRIAVAQRLRPFTHKAGEMCPIPHTYYAAKIYPSRLVVYDYSRSQPNELLSYDLKVQGPVKDFTVQLDLERGVVKVWGDTKEGFYRYLIGKGKETIAIKIEKSPENFNLPSIGKLEIPEVSLERLSLGVDKKQDWELVNRREDMLEILPFWLKLGSMMPIEATKDGCRLEAFDTKDIYKSCFEGLLFSTFAKAENLGFKLPRTFETVNPFLFLSECAQRIREGFFKQTEDIIEILPHISHEFHAGRFINIQCKNGSIDFEWRSRKLRRLIYRCYADEKIVFELPKHLKSYRLRDCLHTRGVVLQAGEIVELKAKKTYYFDHFET